MMDCLKYLLLILFTASISFDTLAQESADIQRDIKAMQDEIAQINSQIAENKMRQKNQQSSINLLDRKIAARQNIVRDIDNQAAALKREMGHEGTLMITYNARLANLRSALGGVLRESYKHTFVAQTFPAATIAESQRMELLRRQIMLLTRQINSQIKSIDSLTITLGSRMNIIRANQEKITELQKDKKGEMELLRAEKSQSAALQQKLRAEEGGLKSEADAKRRRLDALQSQITTAITNEKSNFKTPINTALARQFSQNRGKLPSPVPSPRIVDSYGLHDHPTQKRVQVNNKGVNLQTTNGAAVKSVFEGEVRAIFLVEGMGNSVIVRHGDYLTVYSNIATLNVKKGQKIDTGDVIGNLRADELHFEIWQETKNLNPQQWVRF